MSELDEPRKLAEYAKRAGLDLFEFLNSQQWLTTPKRIKRIELERLWDLQRSMERWDAPAYLRRIDRLGPWTPQQMLTAVQLYITEYIAALVIGEVD